MTTLTDKLLTLHLGRFGFERARLEDVLAYLRQLAHDADQDILGPTENWGVPMGHLLPADTASALRVNVGLENPTLLEALLSTARSVGCDLHVNATGCYILPPALRPWLPVVGRDGRGSPVLPAMTAPSIPGLPEDPASRSPVPETSDTIQQAFERDLPPCEFRARPVEEVIEVLASLAPGIPTLVYNPAGDDLPLVNLAFPERTSFGAALAEVAEQAGMELLYQRTGILLYLPAAWPNPVPSVE